MRWTRNLRAAGAVAVVATAGLLTSNMSPASALGAGVSTGSTTIGVNGGDPSFPLCLPVTTQTSITLNNTGALQVGTALPYVGASKASFTTTSSFFFSPLGIFGSPLCVGPPATVTVTGALTLPAGTDGCPGLAGTFSRVGPAYVLTASGSCTFNGATASSTFAFTGNQLPCFPDGPLPVDPCGIAPELAGAYAQL